MTGGANQSTAGANQTQFLKSQVKIGSIRNGQVNYQKDQTCFNSWDEDKEPNHQKIKETRNIVKNEIDKDCLGTKKPAWNPTVGTTGHPNDEQHQKTLFEVNKGLKDEKIQNFKEKKVYAGCDTRDAYHTGWNVSTETVHPRDCERFLQAT